MVEIESRARPVRVAYLVEDGPKARLTLNDIFQSCYGLWAGRFHLIVPCSLGRPAPAFEEWLDAYDPDVFYSYVDLDDDVVAYIHERYSPSFLVRHETYLEEVAAGDFGPRLPFSPLSIETVLPIAVAPSMFQRTQADRIIEDFKGRSAGDEFGQLNFGHFIGSTGHSYPRYLHQYATPVQILAEDDLQPRSRYGLHEIDTISTTTEAVRTITKKGLLSVAMLSAVQAPRLEISNNRWADAFSIVVGDSFVDRVTFWNARALYPRWRDGQHVDLLVPEISLDDGDLMVAIGEFLLWRNHVNGANQSGSSRVVLRSSSVPIQKLEEMAAALRQTRGVHTVHVQAIESIDQHVPDKKQLERAFFAFVSGIGSAARQNWQRTVVGDHSFILEADRPNHLRYCPPALISHHSGAWACELAISRENDLSQYENVKQYWMLPRRLRFTSAFRKSYQLNSGGAIVTPRVSAGGYLCLFADAETSLGPVSLPDDHAAVLFGYTNGRDWWPFDRNRSDNEGSPAQVAYHAERSGNGRYFHGLMDMFGGLKRSLDVLLHEYWQLQFDRLGASSSKEERKQEYLLAQLKKKFRTRMDEPLSESIEAISDRMFAYAASMRGRLPHVDWASMQSDHETFIERYWLEHPAREGEADNQEWMQHQRDTLEGATQSLCQIGVLHQGYESKCHKCLHRTWVRLDELRPTVECEVCRTEAPAPIGKPWEFRISEFVREALRSQGTLPLFWALSRSRQSREQCFFFDGPVDLYFSAEEYGSHRISTDVDLTIVRDGRVEIVEAKSSVRHLAGAKSFSEVAKRVRPDIATIAVMEAHSPKVAAIFKEYSATLQGTGIEARLLTLKADRDFSHDPSLAQHLSYRVL